MEMALDKTAASERPAEPPRAHDPNRLHHGFHGRRTRSPHPVRTRPSTRLQGTVVDAEPKAEGVLSDQDGSTGIRMALSQEIREALTSWTKEQGATQSIQWDHTPISASKLEAKDIFSPQSPHSSRSDYTDLSPKFHALDSDMEATPSTISAPQTISILIVELQVQIRLAPAVILLAQSPLTPSIVKNAKRHARSAYHFVRTSPGSSTRQGQALTGRCCFYMGVCRLASEPLRGHEHSALQWFLTAMDAKGTYAEGEWAEEWVRKLQRLTSKMGTRLSPTAADSPGSVGSAGGLWGFVTSSVRSAVAAAQGPPVVVKSRETSPISPADRRLIKGNKIPCFESWNTGESGSDGLSSHQSKSDAVEDYAMPWSPDHISVNGDPRHPDRRPSIEAGDADEEDDKVPYNVRGGHIKISDLQPTSPLDDDNAHGALKATRRSISESAIPAAVATVDNELPSPVTSPNAMRSPGRSKSVAFSALEKLSGVSGDGSNSPSPTSLIFANGLLNGRRLSNAANALAIATGIRSADELGLAEEGHSPYKSAFGDEVSRLRKRSTGSLSPRATEVESLD